jgi:hypothetical protein
MNFTVSAIAASIVAAVSLQDSADAAMNYTTLQQASISGNVTKYGSTFAIGASYNGPSTTSSSVFSNLGNSGTPGGGSIYLTTGAGAMLVPGTSSYVTGDSLRLLHNVQATIFQASVSGSFTVQLSTAVDFYAGTFAPQVFTLGGSTLADGTRLQAGTYTLQFTLLNYSQNIQGNYGYQAEALFLQPAAVPAPGAFALLGVANLVGIGRRRR